MRESGHLLGVKIDISMQDRGVDFFPVCCRAQLSLIGFVAGQLVGRVAILGRQQQQQGRRLGKEKMSEGVAVAR